MEIAFKSKACAVTYPCLKQEGVDTRQSKQQSAQPPSKKKLDPKDFMIIGLKGESKVKLPG